MLVYYPKAKSAGEKSMRALRRAGKNPHLQALESAAPEISGRKKIPVGRVEIPLEMIVGTRTAERSASFSADFLPVLGSKTEFAVKWEHVCRWQMEEGITDAVRVVEYRHRFYVEEGNKRVSVLKYIGAYSVTADVARIMPVMDNTPEDRLYQEFLDFYQVVPLYEIVFSREGGYKELARLCGRDLKKPWDGEGVESLRAAYAYFAEIYYQAGGRQLTITAGDAFLVYIRFYKMESLFSDSRELIRTHVQKLWGEFIAETSAGGPVLLEERQIGGESGSWFRKRWTASDPLVAAFLYDGTLADSSRVYGHELGRNQAEEHFGGTVRMLKRENCGNGEKLREAIDEAVALGADIVFTISPSQMAETSRAAIHYPGVRFLNCSLNLPFRAVRTYYSRMYEAKFLMGILAGSAADNHKISYTAEYPIFGAIANINAFAIGASMVDPEARIYLRWTALKQRDEAYENAAKDISVFSGRDFIRPSREGREYGLYRRDGGEIANLAFPVWNWGKYYELILDSVLEGTWDYRDKYGGRLALNYWMGMASGVVDVILSDHLTVPTRRMIEVFRDLIIRDSFNPFEGELLSSGGLIQPDGSGRLDKADIIGMNWLNWNVVGRIPDPGEFSERALSVVEVSGV